MKSDFEILISNIKDLSEWHKAEGGKYPIIHNPNCNCYQNRIGRRMEELNAQKKIDKIIRNFFWGEE